MKFIIKTTKGYVSYKHCGEYGYTQFKDDAMRYSQSQACRVKSELLSKGVMATKVAVCE